MKQEIKAKWVEALRSGEYEQAIGVLKDEGIDSTSYCCLGVLCELAVADGVKIRTVRDYQNDGDEEPDKGGVYVDPENNALDETLPEEVQEWAGVDGAIPVFDFRYEGQDYRKPLSDLNDHGLMVVAWNEGAESAEMEKFDFNKIANVIEFGEEVIIP